MTSVESLPILKLGMAANPRTTPIFRGRVPVDGYRIEAEAVHGSELFYRQLKNEEFDVAEMSLSSLFIAIANGDDRFVGLPIFCMRRFFHTGILVRRDVGIAGPRDLVGKRVGVPEYQQTAMLWIRAILEHEFGVRPKDMTFWMERTPELSHGGLTGFVPPPGVVVNRIPARSSLGEMVAAGELDAALLYLNERNAVDRSRIDLSAHPQVRLLFRDPRAEGIRYFRKTGIFPINHGMVVRRKSLDADPQLARKVFAAFEAANAICEAERREHMAYHVETGLADTHNVEPRLVHHGISANRAVLEAALRHSHEQGLTPRLLRLEEVFAPELMAS